MDLGQVMPGLGQVTDLGQMVHILSAKPLARELCISCFKL